MDESSLWITSRPRLIRILLTIVVFSVLILIFLAGFVVLPNQMKSERHTRAEDAETPLIGAESRSAQVAQGYAPAIKKTAGQSHEGDFEATSGTTASAEPTDAAGADLVAIVNDVFITGEMLRVQQGADAAMASLTGRAAVESPQEGVARLINAELVWQEAQRAQAIVSSAEASSELARLLAEYGANEEALETELAKAGLRRDSFDDYFDRLLTVDRYVASESNARTISPGDYLRTLQAQAEISYGPLAEDSGAGSGELKSETAATIDAAEVSRSAAQIAPDDQEIGALERPGTGIGQIAPAFELPALEPAKSELVTFDRLAGSPVILSFWTTWCPYCRRQTPVLADAHTQYQEQGLQIVGVNVAEAEKTVADYVDTNGIPYAIALDSDGTVADTYSVSGYPTTYFLDAQGRIAARHIGALTVAEIDQYVDSLSLLGE